MLAMVSIFSDVPASAHPTLKGHDHAGPSTEANQAVDKDSTRNFALHVKTHLEAFSLGEVIDFSLFREETRKDPGTWNSGNTYLIVVDKSDRRVVFHGEYKDAGGKEIDHIVYPPLHDDSSLGISRVASNLIESAKGKQEPYCLEYRYIVDLDKYRAGLEGGSDTKWACAVEFNYKVFDQQYIAIVGLHHLSDSLDDCTSYTLTGERNWAEDVVDAQSLKTFVLGLAQCLSFGRLSLNSRQILSQENGPWRSGDIYLFIMTEDRQRVFFNGLNPEFDDTTLNVTDRDGCNVGDEIIRVANGEPNQCNYLGFVKDIPPPDPNDLSSQIPPGGGFVEYRWARPLDPGSRNPDFENDMTQSPGFEPKLTYIHKLDFGSTRFDLPFSLILGAGIYPEAIKGGSEESCDNDGGCAIARTGGYGGTLENAALGLFLIVCVLFLAVSIRTCSISKKHF